jgi:hypothetical protein
MDDLSAALARLADAFPNDAGPASDAFQSNDLFDDVLFHGNWAVGSDQAAFVDRLATGAAGRDTPRVAHARAELHRLQET